MPRCCKLAKCGTDGSAVFWENVVSKSSPRRAFSLTIRQLASTKPACRNLSHSPSRSQVANWTSPIRRQRVWWWKQCFQTLAACKIRPWNLQVTTASDEVRRRPASSCLQNSSKPIGANSRHARWWSTPARVAVTWPISNSCEMPFIVASAMPFECLVRFD